MISRFSITGSIVGIDLADLANSSGFKTGIIYIQIDNDDDVFPVTLQGSVLSLAETGKIKVNDVVHVEGKIRKDYQLQLTNTDRNINKAVVSFQGNYLNIIMTHEAMLS
jgi:hypothetical protein